MDDLDARATPAPARDEDAAAILDLQRLAFRSQAAIYDDWSLPPLVETLHELRLQMTRCQFLKLEFEGQLVGSVRARRLAPTTVSVERLIVAPAYQGRRFGKRLLRAAEEVFPDAERSELYTGELSARNLQLYQSNGYRIFRRQVQSPGVTLVYLEKALPAR